MELKELSIKTCEIFCVDSIGLLGRALMECVKNGDNAKYNAFHELIQDLSIDWLQKIFQYYQADRKEKMQDYTPKSLAEFMGTLAGDAEKVIDMCAGSGALTIQKWNLGHNKEFLLYEYDENVIPYLLFNMALRNISSTICHSDVLQGEVFKTYRISKGEKYGIMEEVENECHIDF